MHILIIDDEPDIREIAEFALSRIGGHTVTAASSAAAGISIATAGGVDAILMDVMMPGMDGIEAARTLRANPVTASTPIVLLTAKGVDSVLGNAPVTGVLSKPFDPITLAREFEELVQWRD